MLAVVAMLELGTVPLPLLLELLLPLVVATPPCFSKVSIEKPKDCAPLLRPKGEARGPYPKGLLRKGMPAGWWLGRVEGTEVPGSAEVPVTAEGSAREPCCMRGWL